MKQSLKDIYKNLIVWGDWKNNYNHFVPQFIEEAVTGNDWSKWDQNVFNEFFHKSSGQCVSSLRQGYFTKSEQEKIKNNWHELAPLFQTIALRQNDLNLNEYLEIKKIIRKYTRLDMRAATNRLIAALQPQLLCTVVNEAKIGHLYTLLSTHISNFDLDWKGNWFENSHQILHFFKKELNQNNGFEILTLPWQVFEEYDPNTIIKSNDMSETETNLEEYLNLLEYKKQIILQGPPGTGKTRLAKEIADELITFDFELNDMALIKPSERFYTFTDKTQFIIEEVDYKNKFFRVKSTQASLSYTVQFDLVLMCIKATGWNQGSAKWNKNGNGQYVVSLAKEISARKLSEIDKEHLKIIQFHPSYSYEDFVRGITAKPNTDGDGIVYEAENKIVAELAIKALDNYKLSQEDHIIAAESIEVKTQFERFIKYVQEQIDADDEHKYTLTEKVYIFDVDLEKRRFKYKGDNWKAHAKGLNMNFSEIEKIIRLGATERSQITNSVELASLTKDHATWFLSIIEKYYAFTNSHKTEHLLNEVKNSTTPKNYVLIIDEINRANLSSVLGELIYALEYRGEAVESMYQVDGSNKLTLPPNLYIIGTMNTADRSVGHIDYAIRRRFAFVDVLPKVLLDDEEIYFNTGAFQKVAALFNDDNVSKEFERDAVQIGHSYFIVEKRDAESEAKRDELFNLKMQYEVKPILLEYERDGILIGTYKGQPMKDYIKSL